MELKKDQHAQPPPLLLLTAQLFHHLLPSWSLFCVSISL